MSATTNLFHNLEHRLSHLRGEREAAAAEADAIKESVTKLADLYERIGSLDKAIEAAQTLLFHDRPDWQSERVKAVKSRVWKSPFRSGEIGRTALGIMRETDDWIRPFDVAKTMLDRIGDDANDVSKRQKLTNTIGAYLKKHEGDPRPRCHHRADWAGLTYPVRMRPECRRGGRAPFYFLASATPLGRIPVAGTSRPASRSPPAKATR